MTAITKSDILTALRERIAATSRRQFSQAHGISPSYLSDVLAGRREPGPKILAALGLAVAYVQQREEGKQ